MATEPVTVQLKRLPHGTDLALPVTASIGSAGIDLRAAIAEGQDLAPGQRCVVPTGFFPTATIPGTPWLT